MSKQRQLQFNTDTYRGISSKDYNNARERLASRIFDLFDRDNSYNGNKGDSLLWSIGFNARYYAREAVDYHIENSCTLEGAIIEVMQKAHKGLIAIKHENTH